MTPPGACVWITRAEPGAGATAKALSQRGFQPLVAPLLTVQPLAVQIDLNGVAALAFTSANGVRAFAALSDQRVLPVFAVGDATAEAARVAGFAAVVSADADAAGLARLIVEHSPHGLLLHPGARDLAKDLVGELVAAGIAARHIVVYETQEAQTLPPEVLNALTKGDLAAILVHSPRAGMVLARLLSQQTAAATPPVFGLSPACLAPLNGLNISKTAAAHPRESDLLALLAAQA